MKPLAQAVMSDAAKERFRSFHLSLPALSATGRPVDVASFLATAGTSTGGTSTGGVTRVAAPATLATTPGITSSLNTRSALTPVPQSVPPAMLRAASSNRIDVDFQGEVSQELSRTIDAICQAIVNAHNFWRQQAFLRNVQIMAVTATGGTIQGPSLASVIRTQIPSTALYGAGAIIGQAVADGIDAAWQSWQSSVRVPGLQWWPSFVAVPGPAAPPTPNIPTPLSALTWDESTITVDALARSMKSRLGRPAPYADQLFVSVATGLDRALEQWFSVQVVTNVLGKGPVPTYAPPYVPVGSVVAGEIVAAPPHFLA